MKSQKETMMKDIENTIIQYKDMIYRIALLRVKNTWDAEDVFQDVFLTYYRKQPVCRDEEHKKAWLIKTAINCSKKVSGNIWKRRVDMKANLEDIAEKPYEFEKEEENQLFYAMRKLPEKHQLILELFYFEELSAKEIASLLNIRETAVRMRLSRAREMLRKNIAEEGKQHG